MSDSTGSFSSDQFTSNAPEDRDGAVLPQVCMYPQEEGQRGAPPAHIGDMEAQSYRLGL